MPSALHSLPSHKWRCFIVTLICVHDTCITAPSAIVSTKCCVPVPYACPIRLYCTIQVGATETNIVCMSKHTHTAVCLAGLQAGLFSRPSSFFNCRSSHRRPQCWRTALHCSSTGPAGTYCAECAAMHTYTLSRCCFMTMMLYDNDAMLTHSLRSEFCPCTCILVEAVHHVVLQSHRHPVNGPARQKMLQASCA